MQNVTESIVPHRLAAWGAIASGIVGIVAVACLVTYLATQAATFMTSGVMPPMGRVLLTTNFVGTLIQALLMMPVALAVRDLGRQRSASVSRVAAVVAVVALAAVALVRFLLLLSPAVSDILFMGPMGFVGLWLVVVNWLLAGKLSWPVRVIGTIAGLGLVIVGLSFFFLGGLAVFSEGPYAYADDVDFHTGIRIGGLPGFTLYPIWAILLGRVLLKRRGEP